MRNNIEHAVKLVVTASSSIPASVGRRTWPCVLADVV